MPNVGINITGGTYKSRSQSLSNQKTQNMYPEIVDANSKKSPYVLHSWPGLTLFGSTPGVDRGMFEYRESLYKISGTSLYYFGSDGSKKYLGEVPGGGRCTIRGLGDDLLFCSDGLVWIYDTDANINDYRDTSKLTLLNSVSNYATGIFLNNDGDKLYVISDQDTVDGYTLSVPFNVETASYDGQFDVSSEETTPTGVFLSSEGSKLYVIGAANDKVFQYTLSTTWDITSASYDSKSLDISSEDITPTGLALSNDGKFLFMIGKANDSVFKYEMTSPWDVSTGSLASSANTLDISGESGDVYSIETKTDGTEFYIIDNGDNAVYQYTATTGWDLSTASYATKTYSTAAQTTTPACVRFKSDGTKSYVLNTSGGIYQYAHSTAWDASTGTYDSVTFDIATEIGISSSEVYGMDFNPSGTVLVVSAGEQVYQLDLTAWDLSTITYNGVFLFGVAKGNTIVFSVGFNSDGGSIYVTKQIIQQTVPFPITDYIILQYNLTADYDLSSVDSSYQLDVTDAGYTLNFSVIVNKSDDTGFYLSDKGNDTAYQYAMSVINDVSTGTIGGSTFSVASETTQPEAISFDADGNRMYILGSDNNRVYQYNLSSYDVATANFINSLEITQTNQAFEGMFFSGATFYVSAGSGSTGEIYQYSRIRQNIDTALEFPNAFDILNNQVVYDGDGNRFAVSNVGDALTIQSANYAAAESSPDNLVRAYVFAQVVYLFCTGTTEPWWNSGVGNPPFDRVEGGIFTIGLAAIHSTANNDDNLYFLGDDNKVYRLPAKQSVSDIALTHAIEGYDTISDAIGLCYSFENQNFYQLTFPSENKTWVYSEPTNQWIELLSGEGRYFGNSHAYAYRKNLIADYRNGNIYELDIDAFDDNGTTVKRIRETGSLYGELFGAPGKKIEMNRFELIMEVGVGLSAGQGIDPVVMLSYSDNGGKTFSTERQGKIGASGQFTRKVEWHNLGSFYERIIRIAISDPVQISIHSASADIEVGI